MSVKRIFSLLLAVALLSCSAALADGISFNGTVCGTDVVRVTAPIGGTAAEVADLAGQTVNAGDVLVKLSTTKVYATEAGTVTGIFGEPGESTETVASRYGAVLYVEGPVSYTISASTENAYNTTATKYVHVGEEVYLLSRSDSSRSGEGLITAVDGTNYTVEITSGDFLPDESVDVFRTPTHKSNSRIGRGSTSRKNPTGYTGSGSIVSLAVQNGDTVEKGQLLFETLDGTFDGYYMSGSDILSTVDGVVAEMDVEEGGSVQKDGLVAKIYTSMRIEASVDETDLCYVHEGDKVLVELDWNQDEDVTYEGTITWISLLGDESESGTTYKVYISFTPDQDTRFGMSAVISTLEDVTADQVEELDEDLEEALDDALEEAPEEAMGE